MSSIDARRALTLIIKKLTESKGYYVWTGLGKPTVWMLRVPRDNGEDNSWQKNEKADMIHICRPSKFWEALEQTKREGLAEYSGYVIDSKCIRCSKEVPPAIEQKMDIQIKLHRLGQKVD